MIPNLNIHCVNLALKYPWLRDFINQSQLIFCDGHGVRWATKFFGLPVPPKIAFTRWIWNLAAFAAKRGYRFYFLGAKPGVARLAAHRLRAKYPKLEIVGTHHGYFQKSAEENERVIREINNLKPDLLIVCFGMPFQEKWIMENWRKLNVHVFLPAGAVFDYVTGRLGKAPEWMLRFHLEWLFRVVQEPKRLSRRYATDLAYFFFRVMTEKLKMLFTSRRSQKSQ